MNYPSRVHEPHPRAPALAAQKHKESAPSLPDRNRALSSPNSQSNYQPQLKYSIREKSIFRCVVQFSQYYIDGGLRTFPHFSSPCTFRKLELTGVKVIRAHRVPAHQSPPTRTGAPRRPRRLVCPTRTRKIFPSGAHDKASDLADLPRTVRRATQNNRHKRANRRREPPTCSASHLY